MKTAEKKCPLVRFKGFTDDWEQRKLIKLVNRISVSSSDDTLPRIEYEDIVAGQGILNKDVYQKDSDKSGIEFMPGDVLFGKLRPYLKNWLLADFKGVAVGDFWILRPNQICSAWIYTLIQTEAFQLVANQSAGSKMPRSDWNIVSNTEFYVPGFDEQQKIGEFFKSIDNLIPLHQCKLDQLTAFKKAMLGKMFPQEESRVPEVRFSGFTDDWEQCKLGDIGAIQTCKRIFKDQTTEKGDIPFYKNGTLGMKADAYISRTIFNEYKTLYPYPEVGDVLMSVVGSIGRTAEYKGADEYFQDSNIVWLKTQVEIIDRRFLKISYQIIDWIIEGSTIKHLYNDNILFLNCKCKLNKILTHNNSQLA